MMDGSECEHYSVCGDPIRDLLKIVSSGFRLFWSYDEDGFQANFRTILWSIHSFTVSRYIL
jgi:hypothetical protein